MVVSNTLEYYLALLHFRTPLLLLMTHHEKMQLKAYTVALTLTLGGYENAIAPIIFDTFNS